MLGRSRYGGLNKEFFQFINVHINSTQMNMGVQFEVSNTYFKGY